MNYVAIPELCRNSNLLILILFVQIIVCIAWLVFDPYLSIYFLGKWSLFSQWTALVCATLLCILRARIGKKPVFAAYSMVVSIIVFSVIVVDLVFVFILRYDDGSYLWSERLVKLIAGSFLVSLLVLRFFALLSVLERRSKAEVESKILALQSRIQPHFLFNSLNTISELTVIDPQKAEKAIGSLSMLFRASLENERKRHSVERELVLARRYIDLEKCRYGDRLTVDWTIELENASIWEIPKLIIQPLLENAIVHGAQSDGSIHVLIDVRESKNYLSFRLQNAKSVDEISKEGNGIALDNIRERLLAIYDDQHVFQLKDSEESFVVLMRLPKRKASLGLSV